jgi:NAD(P)-dependent dehydrogenase (short-subunit alcohol dehydrogenase family)
MSMLDFEGRVAIVTGAGGGLGRSHALMLAARGCRVVVNDIQGSEGAARVAAEIAASGGIAIADHNDVSSNAAALVAQAVASFGRLDIVVNNAGIVASEPFSEQAADAWQRILDVHLMGTVAVCRAAWPHLVRSGEGRIINTSSPAIYGNEGLTAYVTAKAGIFGFSRTLAFEGIASNIRVNSILPSAWTRMTQQVVDPIIRRAFETHLHPECVSSLVVALAHPKCKVFGESFQVCGNMVSRAVFASSAPIGPKTTSPEYWAKEIDNVVKASEFEFQPSAADAFARDVKAIDPILGGDLPIASLGTIALKKPRQADEV